ncbi:hypothetical protein NHX12_008555, partial [Muraenolepis orangiensis]
MQTTALRPDEKVLVIVFISTALSPSVVGTRQLDASFKSHRVVLPVIKVDPYMIPLCCPPLAAILDDPMECSRGERLAITLAKDSINRSSNRSTTGKLEVDIFELLRDSQYEMGETMCQIMSKGVVAVLGPSASPASNSIISNICGQKE